MMKNRIKLSDFKLRFFVDTNVLVDYVEGFNEKKSIAFLNLFKRSKIKKKSKIEEVELVTSDYVLWEFYGHSKEELYIQELVNKHGYGYIAANKECRHANFRYANTGCMRQFGKKIKEYLEKMKKEGIIYPVPLIGKHIPGFSETMEAILQCSKFPYKDAIVLVSAYFSQANAIITRDEQHFGKSRIKQLKDAMESWPINPGQIEIKKPEELSSLQKIRLEYENWFITRNKNKVIGEVVKYYPRSNVIEVKCIKNCLLNHQKDNIYLVKFFNNKVAKFFLDLSKVKSSNFKHAKTKRAVKKGRHVTIKLPSRFPYKNRKWEKGMVFFAE